MKTKFSGILTLLLAFVVQFTFAQEKTISGTVSDENGLPLPTATVIIQGTSTGASTDFDGNYSISAKQGDVLIFSYVGYANQSQTVGASSKIDVSLQPDNTLDEVVVTALGIKREEKALGYASQQVKSEELTTVRDGNIVNSLSGKVAGVNVTSASGAVGAESRIVIRGITSISGDTQPLVVVDGVVLDNGSYGNSTSSGGTSTPNGLADLNQDDIESINVLKGGAATSLYGMRGANGVLVVTTKSGRTKSDKLGIEITSSASFENPFILPDYQNSYGQGNSASYFEYVDGVTGDGGVDESWGPALDAGLEFVQWDSVNGEATPWVSYPDNVKDFFETGITTNNNIAFTKSSETVDARLSLGLTDQQGILYNTDLRKYNISTKVNMKLSDKWTAGVSVNYIKTESSNLPSVGYGDANNQLGQLVWSARNVDYTALKDWRNLPTGFAAGTDDATPINWNLAYNNNPYWSLDTNTNAFDRDRINGNVNLAYQISEKFSVSAQTGLDYFNSLDAKKRAFGTYETPRGSYQEVIRTRSEINSQAILSYNTNIGEDFKTSLNVGGNMMVNDYHLNNMVAGELQVPGVYNISNTRDGVTPTLQQFTSKQQINSIFGFAQLSYRDYLFIDVTGRNDWASVLPEQNNNFFYPSVTGSAIVTDMFDISGEAVSYLKLRGGWSKVGSAGPLSPYSIAPSFAFSTSPWDSTPVAYLPGTLYNPEIGNEDTTEYEIGLETRLFNNRINLNATYYDKETTDVIMAKDIDPASGYTAFWDNVADITNKGVELSLGAKILRSDDGFNLGVNINFAKNTNEASNIDDDPTTNDGQVVLGGLWNVDVVAREGEAVGALYGPGFLRDDAGNIIYENGLPQADATNKILGNINPDWTGGLGINMSYKNFSLSTLFDVKSGGDIYSQTNSWGKLAGVLEETTQGRETGIVGQGVMDDGTGNYVPNTVVTSAQSFFSTTYSQNIAESSVYDASFVKWRELALTYTIPSSLFKNTGIDNISVGATVRNVAILYKKVPHIDPESAFSSGTGNQGLEYAQIPSTRSIGFNLNLKF
ncbi:SusC/RagA family TonB-linked outer membrane protein [Lacinutrix sp. C3R15]|uniref:SusC/RagA family TonB-linked outer membrane protein n=1 Tax=Flavobacteriaceae TaxID=49546 RepID=UPI001C09963D|nr:MULTISPECIES: SusC/RagA family TonB-linked outer membrane protein [Flavobacteriaceae]MBU2939369.1 SusC/RagA family TonB-linked outer membrane protein [Lacinutrix sp. C3R15]MDO6622684.1 SusC/RagA family TonB-linked outer membrane protein [Oceanihabitans sp. 1_MG-2023]